MTVTRITRTFSVAGQPSEAEIAALGQSGIALLINNRPDHEEAGQPASAVEKSAAEAAGLAYAHIPVTGASITRADVDRFADAVSSATGPVLAHCRSGTRSLTLWVLGEVLAGRMDRAEVLDFGTRHGFDLRGARAWLDAQEPEGG